MTVTDVALARNTLSDTPIDRTTLIRQPIDLGGQLWLGRLDQTLTGQILDACEPRGLNYQVNRAWGVMYALYRTDAPRQPGSLYQWDPDHRLSLAMRMSRLVHPTSLAYEFSARVVENEGSPDRIIAPSYIKGWGTRAYVVNTQMNWLTTDHASQLRQLLTVYDHDALPERVKSALFYFEYAALTYFIDLRWVSLTTACESLIHIDGERDPANPQRFAGSTQVFVTRMSQLTRAVLGAALPEVDLRAMYRARSALAHGQDFTGLTSENRRLYVLHEDTLRAILRKVVLEQAFAATFQDDTSIQATLPL